MLAQAKQLGKSWFTSLCRSLKRTLRVTQHLKVQVLPAVCRLYSPFLDRLLDPAPAADNKQVLLLPGCDGQTSSVLRYRH